MKTLNTRRHGVAGMSLIEVLVAVLLISFGLLGLVSLQTRSVQMSVSAEDRQRAALLASELASEMWSLNNVNLPANITTGWIARVATPAAGGLPNGVGTVTLSGVAPAQVARITVTWRPPSAATSATNRYTTDVLITP